MEVGVGGVDVFATVGDGLIQGVKHVEPCLCVNGEVNLNGFVHGFVPFCFMIFIEFIAKASKGSGGCAGGGCRAQSLARLTSPGEKAEIAVNMINERKERN